jgi:hypothetical protein
MTKYFVMRECENIPTWISLCVTTVFSQQGGISVFKFRQEVFGVLLDKDLTLLAFLTLSFLSHLYQPSFESFVMLVHEAQPMVLTLCRRVVSVLAYCGGCHWPILAREYCGDPSLYL